ncbi:MAG: spore coat protein CotJB [Clostridiales bacterium]|nr:spore coat protein CotJB [Clostridiales bacterium]
MNRESLLRRLSAVQFAMWESHVYLDTHPCDPQATKMYEGYKEKYEVLAKEYENLYGPLTLNGKNSDDWLQDPWPWDYTGEGCK